MSASTYYLNNFQSVKSIVSGWKESGLLVERAKEAVHFEEIFAEFVETSRHYQKLIPILYEI